ncbi:MAG: HAD family hydrolase [Pseudomonadota bacterium]
MEPLPEFLASRACVIFDMDGTLYRQKQLRLKMARALLWHTLTTGQLRTVSVIRDFRKRREALADARTHDFEAVLFDATAAACGCSTGTVRAIVAEWIETRPLPHLAATRTAGADALFDALRTAGIKIAVWSDYPAKDKLAALDLAADLVVAATDDKVRIMKPDPSGLDVVVEALGCRPEDCLMVGDRDERDGAAAAARNVPYIRVGSDALPDFSPAALREARWPGTPQ